ncbi:Mu transposase C-terminal domain-containing protein [Paraburkholderia aspalathi]|uniref:Mu transposase, C-terminal n=1 Tax=Paraburkholderia aspalathi TaxID=1324617 RepID=A0A1I7EQY8_9BURK|nr:Mu transposase C-terminal domain-containing protein [Paraburkholderia aspalathi]SFU26330.1 Mu transposase, C-terminal [Paraburkholderia aspalathi]
MALLRNDLFHNESGTRYRLLHVTPETDEAWIINVTDEATWPRKCSYAALLDDMDKQKSALVASTGQRSVSEYTDAAKNRRKETWNIIDPLLASSAIFDPKLRGPLVSARAEATGASKTTINKYLRDYWRGGQTQDALIPDFLNIGLNQPQATNARGRRPSDSRYEIYQMHRSVDDEHVIAAVKEHFLNGEVPTLQDAFREMLKEHYSYQDGNGASYVKPSGERPSYRQFYTVVKRCFSLETILRRKKGNKDFERDHDQRIGSALYEAIGVGYIYEIDATIADVFLVAQADRAKIIGKPTLYLIYDRYSRLCAGFYVGLEHPGWETAVQAILSLAEDKAALCHKYGVPYDPRDWPADRIFPQKFLGDCGEMISRNSNRICDGMESTISNAPPLSPQNKGTVECGFRLIHASIAAATPGYEPPSNVMRRRGKHYDSDACLTLDEFTAIILRAIIAHNRREMKKYALDPRAALRGVSPIPREVWEDNVVYSAGVISRYNEDYLRLQLLPRDKATVTDQGVLFKGCFYSCADLEKKGWFVSAANRGRFDVDVSYDRRLVDSIVVHDPQDARKSYSCGLTTTSESYRGYSYAEVKYVQTTVKRILQDGEDNALQEKINLKKFISDIAEPAHAAMKQATRGKSRSSRKADIAADREAEKRARRQSNATSPSSPRPPVGADRLPDNVVPMPDRSATVAVAAPQPPVKVGETQVRPLSIQEKLRLKKQEMLSDITK